jgi:inorganic pyrophosphatase
MSYKHIPIGKKTPEVINAIIEISRGSNNKYEYDEELDVIKLDRVLYSPFFYPLDYGFIPETRSEDGDHQDVLVLGSEPLAVGTLVEVRPVALVKMIDSGEEDFKILGVQKANPRFDWISDLSDLEHAYGHLLKEVKHFFERMKDLQGKSVEIQGFENAESAKNAIKAAMEVYNNESH